MQIEREAMKKLQNVRKDHDKRLTELSKVQTNDRDKAELITRNQKLVDSAILAVQAAIATQVMNKSRIRSRYLFPIFFHLII